MRKKNQKTLVERLKGIAGLMAMMLIGMALTLGVGVIAYSGGEPDKVIENVENYYEAATEVVEVVKESIGGVFETNKIFFHGGLEYSETLVINSETNESNSVERSIQIKDWPTSTSSLTFTAPSTWATSTLVDVRLNFAGTASEVASSSYRFGCGIETDSARASHTADISSLDGVVNAFVITTSSLQTVMTNTSTKSVIQLVEPDSELACYGQFYSITSGTCDKDGVECEAVTSTNRGFTLQVEAIWERLQ